MKDITSKITIMQAIRRYQNAEVEQKRAIIVLTETLVAAGKAEFLGNIFNAEFMGLKELKEFVEGFDASTKEYCANCGLETTNFFPFTRCPNCGR
jgi:ribosomal protein L7/L12